MLSPHSTCPAERICPAPAGREPLTERKPGTLCQLTPLSVPGGGTSTPIPAAAPQLCISILGGFSLRARRPQDPRLCERSGGLGARGSPCPPCRAAPTLPSSPEQPPTPQPADAQDNDHDGAERADAAGSPLCPAGARVRTLG